MQGILFKGEDSLEASTVKKHRCFGAANASAADGQTVYETQVNSSERTPAPFIGSVHENLLTNPSFENNSAWTGLSTTQSIQYDGAACTALYASASNPNRSVTYDIYLTAGSYVFSAYVRYASLTAVNAANPGGVALLVKNASHSVIAQTQYYYGSSFTEVDEGWIRLSVPFTVSSDGYYDVSVSTVNAVGTVHVDCAKLETGNIPTAYNMLQNGTLEKGTSGWLGGSLSNESVFGNKSLAVNGGCTASQTLTFSNAPSEIAMILSGWCKTGNNRSDAKIGLQFHYSNGYTSDIEYVDFQNYVNGRQYIGYIINSPIADFSSRISSLTVFLENGSSSSPIYFDDIVLAYAGKNETTEDESQYSQNLQFHSRGNGTCYVYNRGTCTDTDIRVPKVSPAGDVVDTIGSAAFRNYEGITSVTIPDSVTMIDSQMLKNTGSVETVIFEGPLTAIPGETFYNCWSLKNVVLPETVNTIGYSAFNSCIALESLILPSSLTTIGNYAFIYDESLKFITIPAGVTSIGDAVFYGCSSDLVIYYEGSQSEWEAISFGINSVPSYVEVRYDCEVIDGVVYYHNYDNNHCIQSTTAQQVGIDGEVIEYVYDINGNIVSLKDKSGIKTYTYDIYGNLSSYTDPLGNITSYTYNVFGQMESHTDANGSTTEYEYNTDGLVSAIRSADCSVQYSYNYGKVSHIRQTSGTSAVDYYYCYNSYGQLEFVFLGATTIKAYQYLNNGRGRLSMVSYPNGYIERYTYDDWGNISSVSINNNISYEYLYDVAGRIISVIDFISDTVENTHYGIFGEVGLKVSFDNIGKQTLVDFCNGTMKLTNGEVYSSLPDSISVHNELDDLQRMTSWGLSRGDDINDDSVFIVSYYYDDQIPSCYLADQVKSEKFSNGSAYGYEYDAIGNLTKVYEGGIIEDEIIEEDNIKITYTYDALSQLIREDNAYEGKSYTWTYDSLGDITSKITYAYSTTDLETAENTVTYSYGNSSWYHQLTSYYGTSISYDSIGNPLNWRNASSITWEGRQLTGMTTTGGTALSFAYNIDGLRTKKTVGTDTVKYVWNGSELLQEIHSNYTLTFYYDAGEVIGFNYKAASGNSDYFYGRNTLGVITYLYDANGAIVTTYRYDAWGRLISATGTAAGTIGTVNPIRYKGYYYDSETGFYYLQSRYYDPTVERFINADDLDYLGVTGTIVGFNLFTYCENKPVMLIDADGKKVLPNLVASGIQIEIGSGVLSFGIEVIIAGRDIFMFKYGAGSFANSMTNILNYVINDFSNLFIKSGFKRIGKFFSGGYISVCVFAVFSYTTYYFRPADYEGKFFGAALTIPTVYGVGIKTYVSRYEIYSSVGIGFSYPFSAGISATAAYYWYMGSKTLPQSFLLRLRKETKGIKP